MAAVINQVDHPISDPIEIPAYIDGLDPGSIDRDYDVIIENRSYAAKIRILFIFILNKLLAISAELSYISDPDI